MFGDYRPRRSNTGQLSRAGSGEVTEIAAAAGGAGFLPAQRLAAPCSYLRSGWRMGPFPRCSLRLKQTDAPVSDRGLLSVRGVP